MFKRFTTWLQNSISEEGKKRIVANIEAANSQEYRMQVAEHHLLNAVIDDILNDPFWFEIAKEALEAKG